MFGIGISRATRLDYGMWNKHFDWNKGIQISRAKKKQKWPLPASYMKARRIGIIPNILMYV